MITNKLTDEFIDTHYFVLDVPIRTEVLDVYGSTCEVINFDVGTEWQMADDSYEGGDIYLDELGSNACLVIPVEDFRKMFTAHEWCYVFKEV